MACKTAFMLRSLPLSHSSGLIFLEGGLVVCPLSVSLSSKVIKSSELSMLSKTLGFCLSSVGGFALSTKKKKKEKKNICI